MLTDKREICLIYIFNWQFHGLSVIKPCWRSDDIDKIRKLKFLYYNKISIRQTLFSHQTGWTALVANLQKYIAIREKWISSVHMAQLRKISNTGIPLDIDIMLDLSSEGEMSS